MERLLKPEKLNVLPEEPDAAKIYDFWLKTFESFLTAVERIADEGENVDRLALLTNFLSPQTFPYIADTDSYDDATEVLKHAYHKRKNVIFARHVLMTRVQKSDETIAKYVYALKTLSKDCEFNAVTAEQHKDCMTRDAFLYGLTSAPIRQRLLEEDTLDLNAAVKKEEMLELAKRQSVMYNMSHKCSFPASISVAESKKTLSSPSEKSYRLKSIKKRFFCGGKLHAGGRSKCPARNQACLSCGKVGHF